MKLYVSKFTYSEVYIYSFNKSNIPTIFYCFHFRLGETCSHVAAMCYKVETAVRIGLTKATPTDLPCKWNQNFTKNIDGETVATINIYTDKAKAKLN